MGHQFDCSCYQCGYSWKHEARKLWAENGAECPSCKLWIPVSESAKSRVEFVTAVDRAGGGPFVTGSDFSAAVREMDQEAADRDRRRNKWWQVWKWRKAQRGI